MSQWSQLLAVSCPSYHPFYSHLNDRFREKLPFIRGLRKTGCRTAAMRSEADISLELAERSANDPKRT